MIETKEAKLNDEKIPEEAEVEISRVRSEKVTKEPAKEVHVNSCANCDYRLDDKKALTKHLRT